MSANQISISFISEWAGTDTEKWEKLTGNVFLHKTLGPLALKDVGLPYLTMIKDSEEVIWDINDLEGFFHFVTLGENCLNEVNLFIDQLKRDNKAKADGNGKDNVMKKRQAHDMQNAKPEKVFTDDSWGKSRRIIGLGDYHPWKWHKIRGGNRDNYDKHSGLILDLKDNREPAIAHFVDILDKAITPRITLSFVPSHDATKKTSGIRLLVVKLAAKNGRQDATDCIIRTKTIPKLSQGGNRNEAVQLDSLKITETEKVFGKTILIIDDVTTTGNSLKACKKLFIEAGAARVRSLALGMTV